MVDQQENKSGWLIIGSERISLLPHMQLLDLNGLRTVSF